MNFRGWMKQDRFASPAIHNVPSAPVRRFTRRDGTKQRAGFTLIEVLLVLAILGVIMALVVPQLMGRQKQANIDATKLSIKGLESALGLYQVDHFGNYPTTAQGLDVLVVPQSDDPGWKGPYLENAKNIPADAWGNPLQYQYPGQNQVEDKPDIWSWGADQTPGTEDDIANWSMTQ